MVKFHNKGRRVGRASDCVIFGQKRGRGWTLITVDYREREEDEMLIK